MSRALAIVATGEYNEFMPKLIETGRKYFGGHFYVFTDQPNDYKKVDITTIEIPHYGWPKMPLLRFETFYNNKDVFEQDYIFTLDAEAEFVAPINNSINDYRVATLHRNITRLRQDFNYESRIESTAYIAPHEGEKYYACGFVGGARREFLKMCETLSRNIRADIYNGIRARWGDESHINRYLIDNPPTTILPPNYMCPWGNPYFVPFIKHRDKQFKRVNVEDTEKYLVVNPKDYE
ncbi:MAG: hypothetical protein WD361_10535 [Gracilimonas sp.]